MSVINYNYLSQVAQNNLEKSQSSLGTAIERLSSGLRINSAKDDAAGQAIANRFTANIQGLTQAARNANDGISLAQTTEGALKEINNNILRIRELATQAATGGLSASDRKSAQDEIKLRLEEIDRVAEQTQFNGVKVLSKDQKMAIQVGANDGETIDIDLKKLTSETLGLKGFNVNGPQGTLADVDTTGFQAAYGTTSAVTKATVNDFAADLATNLGIAATAVTVTKDKVFSDANGNWFAAVEIKATTDAEVKALAAQGIEATKNTGVTFHVALDPNAAALTAGGDTAAFTITGSTLQASSLMSGATSGALGKLDESLAKLDETRSGLGAVQNRLISTVSNLKNTITNLSAARSRIEDADYAVEVSNMGRSQIIQQAGMSVLAQANQVPQGVLALLR